MIIIRPHDIKYIMYWSFRFLKCVFGFATIKNNDICWFSEKFFDIHDYPENKGGDGYPRHFSSYNCTKCGKEFTI